MKRASAAFTLVELLVVLAIIAVLAGLLLPVLGKVGESGRNAKCVSNLHQIGAGLLAFAGENNQRCPIAGGSIPYNTTSPATGSPGWSQQLEPYMGTDRRVYICPTTSQLFKNNVQYSYFMGCHAAMASAGHFAALKLPLLVAPSKYILAGDISSNMFEPTDTDKDDYTQDPAFSGLTAKVHNGRANLVFADGHVAGYEAFTPGAMTTHYELKPDGTGFDYSDNPH